MQPTDLWCSSEQLPGSCVWPRSSIPHHLLIHRECWSKWHMVAEKALDKGCSTTNANTMKILYYLKSKTEKNQNQTTRKNPLKTPSKTPKPQLVSDDIWTQQRSTPNEFWPERGARGYALACRACARCERPKRCKG